MTVTWFHPPSRRVVVPGAASALTVGLGVLAAGCSSPPIDPGKVEDAIRAEAGAVSFDEVTCPPDIAVEVGASFECVATGNRGTRVIVTVTQQDDQGAVRIVFGRGIVQTGAVASMLDADVEATLDASVELTCPDAVLLADNSGSFTCTGVDEGGDRFTISVRVDDGKVAPDGWDLVE